MLICIREATETQRELDNPPSLLYAKLTEDTVLNNAI